MGGGTQVEQLLCAVCNQLPNTVMESNCCFTIFCKKCVMRLARVSEGDCPSCGKCARGFQSNIALQRLVDQQEIHCKFRSLGCDEVLEFKDKDHHEEGCGYKITDCPQNCQTMILLKDLQAHKDLKCPLRQVTCSNADCGAIMPLALLDLHTKSDCNYRKVRCNQCFKEFVKKGLQEHLDNTCPESLVTCPYSECGCCEKIPRGQLRRHLDRNTKLHLQLVMRIVGKQQQEILSLKKELAVVKEKKVCLFDSLQEQVDHTLAALQEWCYRGNTKAPFNLMYLWFLYLVLLVWASFHGNCFGSQSCLAILMYCVFLGYYMLVHQIPELNWHVKLLASGYFLFAWHFLVWVCF